VAASIAALDLLEKSTDLRDRLERNVRHFRQRMSESGFAIIEGEHAIVPIMLGDAALASRVADAMLEKGVYVIGFSYPVVPQGKARIRAQVSAAHSLEDLDFAVEKFSEVKAELID
jgi:glycine C-acetyltransferase